MKAVLRQFNKEPGRAIFQILRNFLDISGHPMPDCDFCEQGLVLVLCRCQYGCIRQNTREPDVSCHCASVGVLEQRGRGGCRGYSGPATQHRGHQNRLPRALVTSSRGERAQTRDTRVVATALNLMVLSLNTNF